MLQSMGSQRVGHDRATELNWTDWILLMIKRGFPDSSVGKESICNAGDPGLIPGLGRSAGEGIGYPLQYSSASLVAQKGKNPPAILETWVQSMGLEDPPEKGKAAHSSILAGEFHGLCNPWGHKESDTTEWRSLSLQFQWLKARKLTNSWKKWITTLHW